MKFGSIYIIRNTVNKKVYVGQTTMSVSERFAAHMKPSTAKQKHTFKLYNAINKYGADKFYVEVLEENIPIEELDDKEVQYIHHFNSFKNGYNSTPGGDGRVLTKIEREDELLRLASNGMKAKEIALLFGCNKATVIRTLHKLGFWYHADKGMIVSLAKDGLTNEEIAKIMKCSNYTVSRALDKAHMRRRRAPVKNRDLDIDAIHADYDAQMPIDKICEKYDISKSVFGRIRTDNNFKTRPQIYKNKIRYHD